MTTIKLNGRVVNVSCAAGQWKVNMDLQQPYLAGGYELLGNVTVVVDESTALELASLKHPLLNMEITDASDV